MSEHDALVERAVGGCADALEQLLRANLDTLRAALHIDARWQRCLDFDDVVQVTSLEAFLRIGTLSQPTLPAFRAWLRRIAEHNLVDAVRGLERQKRPDAQDRVTHGPEGQSARTLLLAVAGEQVPAGGRAALDEELARMRAALLRLPASYRDVLERVDLADATVREVADATGRTPGAVHMLRSRALERLRELLL